MKKAIRLIGIIALAVIIGFSIVGCNDPDDNNKKNNKGSYKITATSIKFTNVNLQMEWDYFYWDEELEENIHVFDLENITGNTYDGTLDGFYNLGGLQELSDSFTNPIVKIQNGKLTIDLGVPTQLGTILNYCDFDGEEAETEVLFIRKFEGIEFEHEDIPYIDTLALYLTNGQGVSARFVYADRPVVLNGSGQYGNNTYDNVSLKTGWNVVFVELEYEPEHGYVTSGTIRNGTLNSSFKWRLTTDHSF